eukprot:GFUD01002072.1.p1 GENE.GFUD01002072.1~~GFUD01002072.1.p1  ORF type:complete len:746 (+),score=163.19 GFUD01002072.1:144-2381(+)
MARVLAILVVLTVAVAAISAGESLERGKDLLRYQSAGGLETAGGSERTKRSRANSRYSPASPQVNPNRGRKRIRLTDSRPEVQTERTAESIAVIPPRNFNQGSSRASEPQTTTPPRNINRGGPRPRPRSRPRTRPALRNFETTTEKVRVPNRLTTRPVQTRSRNIKNNRNNNRFYEETAEKRNELFSDNKAKYCRPGSNDYYDYDDYDRIDIQSSQNGAPLLIEVTHQLPLATQRNNFRIPNIISSVEEIAVSGLKSTDVDNLPVIYANAYTLTRQPGYKEILYDALQATETLQVTFAPTCLNGRQTSYSQLTTSTIYSVQTVTEKIYEAVIPTQNLNELLLQFLPDAKKPSPALFQPASQLILNTAPLTTFITHTSTYVTKVTETESSELSINFRGKAIVTTLIDTSVKEITATEFSTETIVTTQLITQTAPAPQALSTPLLSQFIGQPDDNIEKQLLLAELDNLLSKQSVATPPIVQELVQSQAVEGPSLTYEVTHTSTYVTTLTEENSEILSLTFRGRAIETTLYDTATKVITATEYSTETVTQSAAPSPPAVNILPTRISQPQNDNLDLINLLPELAEQLALFEKATPQAGQSNFELKGILPTNVPNPLEDALFEQQLIEALAGHINDNEIKSENNNIIINQTPIETESKNLIQQAEISPDVPERQFSVTTIFKSGRKPGDFTRILSTVYFDELRSKREARIDPSKSTIEDKTQLTILEPDGAEEEENNFTADFIQSGKHF